MHRRIDHHASLPSGPFDVILCGLSLNEILLPLSPDQRAAAGAEFLRGVSTRLAVGGCLVVLEPALRDEARTLSEIRDALVADSAPPWVFAPCLGTASCPMLARARDWCHQRLPAAFPAPLAELSRAAGLRDEELTYSYLTLRLQQGNLAALASPEQRAYRVVGGPVLSKGKREFALCGATDAPRLLQLDRHRVKRGDPLDAARRGTILGIAGADMAESSSTLRADPALSLQTLLHWSKRADVARDPS